MCHPYLNPESTVALSLICLSNLVIGHCRQLPLRGLNEALEDVLDRVGLRYRVALVVGFPLLLLRC